MKQILTFILSIIYINVIAQNSSTIMVNYSGISVSLKQDKKEKSVKPNETIPANSTLVIDGKGWLQLKRNDGKYKKIINNNQKKELQTLNIEWVSMEASIFANIESFIKNYLLEPKRMKTSSTHKGGTYYYYPMLLPADNELILTQNIKFIWLKDIRLGYELVLENDKGLLDSVKFTRDTSSCANGTNCLFNIKFEEGINYYWTIQDSKLGTDSNYSMQFRLASKSEIDKVSKAISELDKMKDSLENDDYVVIKSTIYEDNKMYTKAYEVLKDGLKVNSENPYIKEAFNKLILRLSGMNQRPD